jgi:hypothetical protein
MPGLASFTTGLEEFGQIQSNEMVEGAAKQLS